MSGPSVQRNEKNDIPGLTSQPTDTLSLDRQWAQLALLGTTVSLLIAAGFCLLRTGLSTPPLLVPACVTVVAASLFAPLLLPQRGLLRRVENRAVALPLAAFVMLTGIVLAFAIGQWLVALYAAMAVTGLCRAARLLRGAERPAISCILAISVAVAAYLFITVHNLGYAGALTNEQSLLGILNHDTRFHAGIAFMIQNFGIPSIAVDGVLPLKYHFGSHIWFAALGTAGGATPAASYGAAVPIVAAPMLVMSLLLAAMTIDRARKPLTDYIVAGLALVFFADAIDIKSYYISESYTFGLIGTLLLLPLMARLAITGPLTRANVLGFAVAIAGIPVLLSFKISAGILWTTGFGWIVLRRFGIAKETVIIGVATTAVLLGAFSMLAPGPNDYRRISTSVIVPFYYLRVDPTLGSITSLIGPLCLAFYASFRDGFRRVLQSRSDLMVEATLLVTAVGTIPPLLGIPQDSSVWYFLNVGQWYSFAILASRLSVSEFSEFTGNIRRQRLFVPAAIVLLFVIGGQAVRSFTPAFFDTFREVVRTADKQADGQLLKGRPVSRYFADTLRTDHALFGADFKAAMAASAGSRLISLVQSQIGTQSLDSAVFVPPRNLAYWDFQSTCRDKHNILTALTGQPSLLGGPPASYNCPKDAYTTPYGDNYFAREIADTELCAHAQSRKIKRVYVLNDVYAPEKNRMLACDATNRN